MQKRARALIDGDIFEYQGHIEVAISNWNNGTVWVSTVELYKEARCNSTYTNSALISIDGDTVVSYERMPSPIITNKMRVLDRMECKTETTARNSMGCSENWYDPPWAIAQTFTRDEILAMRDEEVDNLIKLAETIGEGLY